MFVVMIMFFGVVMVMVVIMMMVVTVSVVAMVMPIKKKISQGNQNTDSNGNHFFLVEFVVVGRSRLEEYCRRDMQEYPNDDSHDLVKMLGYLSNFTATDALTRQESQRSHGCKDSNVKHDFVLGQFGVK